MEDYFNRVFTHETNNYPPYNLVAVTEDEFKLEIVSLNSEVFSETDVKVFTERGKLVIEGAKSTDTPEDAYVHRGLAQRSFTRAGPSSSQNFDDTEVKSVEFVNGLLTVTLGRRLSQRNTRRSSGMVQTRPINNPYRNTKIAVSSLLNKSEYGQIH